VSPEGIGTWEEVITTGPALPWVGVKRCLKTEDVDYIMRHYFSTCGHLEVLVEGMSHFSLILEI